VPDEVDRTMRQPYNALEVMGVAHANLGTDASKYLDQVKCQSTHA
jgi:hypothetical protein